MASANQKLTRIGVFYDGNYFLHVSNYYCDFHQRQARLSVSGLHEYIRQTVGGDEGVDPKYCQIVDAHYFRGRLRAQEAEERNVLLGERMFDDVLMKEGITTHYLPLGPRGEKGIDVWLALEALELAIYKHFDVIVLIAGDGDFVPLVRKLNTIGTRVMLLSWDFKYIDANKVERGTRTSQQLLEEVTYPKQMHDVIDDRASRGSILLNGLFVTKSDRNLKKISPVQAGLRTGAIGLIEGEICSLHAAGYGWVAQANGGNDLYFHGSALLNAHFSELQTGNRVRYEIGSNDKGPCAIEVEVALS